MRTERNIVTDSDAPSPILTHMIRYLQQLVSSLWNRLQGRRQARKETGSTIVLGFQVADDEVSRRRVGLSPTRRTMHVALLGKTGTGKSSLLKSLCQIG